MKILLVSSVNLTTDPRIFKELELAHKLNYKVTFVGFNIGNWSDAKDEQIREQYPDIDFFYLDATRKNYFRWLYISLAEVIIKLLWVFNKQSLKLCAIAHTKRTIQLLQLLDGLTTKGFNLIVAHTLAALYPVLIFSKKTGCKFGFDVEDYHPGEKTFEDTVNEKERRERLLRKCLLSAAYITAASPLISANIQALVPGIKVKTVLNYFPKDEFVMPRQILSNKIKLVWFSQNINEGRGLELILTVWDKLKMNFELTLIGNSDSAFYNEWIKDHEEIIIKNPIPQNELHTSLADYDVGLAIDVDTADYNRKLAITNKLLAYYQAGLYILATNTAAQRDFIKNNTYHGSIVEQTSLSILDCLAEINDNKEQLRKMRTQRYTNASRSSWENESLIILKQWENINSYN